MTIMFAEAGFEPAASRLWASRATTAPLCRMPAPRLQGGCEREEMLISVASCIFTMPSYHSLTGTNRAYCPRSPAPAPTLGHVGGAPTATNTASARRPPPTSYR